MVELKKGNRILISGSRVLTVLSVDGDLITCYDDGYFGSDDVAMLVVIKQSAIVGYM